jgi:hypothetical protein
VLTSEAEAAGDGVLLAQELGMEQAFLELENFTQVIFRRSKDGGYTTRESAFVLGLEVD